jgi:beta-glucanase (GH16 family)
MSKFLQTSLLLKIHVASRLTPTLWRRLISAGVAALCLLPLLGATLRADDWQLVWSDEFDYQGRPDQAKWDYEVGMVRNNEPQCYTKSLKNARVDNGSLILEAVKGKVFDGAALNPFIKKKKLDDRLIQDYSSASLCTLGKASWLYGKFEIRAKLPSQAGTWPVFWTLGTNHSRGVRWPLCGEIDIMERMWQRNGDALSGIMTTVHFKRLLRRKPFQPFRITPLQGATSGLHIYSMEWTPNRIDFLVDGTLCNSVNLLALDEITPDNPFHKPQYLLLSLALNQRNKGFRDASFPARFEVDYVRVYQKKGAGL